MSSVNINCKCPNCGHEFALWLPCPVDREASITVPACSDCQSASILITGIDQWPENKEGGNHG